VRCIDEQRRRLMRGAKRIGDGSEQRNDEQQLGHERMCAPETVKKA